MLILFITRKYRGQPPAADDLEETFREHDDTMKCFRRAHSDLSTLSTRDIVLTDGDLLAPVNSVEPGWNTQN